LTHGFKAEKMSPFISRQGLSMTAKQAIGGLILVGLVFFLAIGSNSALDHLGVADEGGLTVKQQKNKAARNQQEWDRYKGTR
jgi:hypothetical protein